MKTKVVLVTGAARGLGGATARAFADAGASLCLVDIDAERLEQTRAEVSETGAKCIAHATDISTKENCVRAVESAVEAFGQLDVLCNVAAVLRFHNFIDVTSDDWERVLSVNLSGPFFLSQAAIPHLLKTHGNIVNVVSQSAIVGAAYIVPYAASKAALLQLTKSMAMEYMKEPIRINAVSPGTMRTEIGAGLSLPADVDQTLVSRYAGIRDASEPEDVADVIVFVASDRAKSIHGACVPADNGITAG